MVDRGHFATGVTQLGQIEPFAIRIDTVTTTTAPLLTLKTARIAIALMVAMGLTACLPKTPSLPPGTLIELTPVFTGKYSLTDANGTVRSPADFTGKLSLIYFGFTSCPDVCPTALNVMVAGLNELADDTDQIQPLFTTVDPEHDTQTVLHDYLSFDKRILGLTGSVAAIDQAKSAYKIYAERQNLPDSALGYTMDHSSLFYLVNRQGVPVYAIKDTITPQQLAGFIRYYLRTSS